MWLGTSSGPNGVVAKSGASPPPRAMAAGSRRSEQGAVYVGEPARAASTTAKIARSRAVPTRDGSSR